jgi:hypothetical protein
MKENRWNGKVVVDVRKVATRAEEGQTLLVNIEQNNRVVLNHEGAAVWDAIVSGCTVSDLVDLVVKATGGPIEYVSHQLLSFLDLLGSMGFVTVDRPPLQGDVPHLDVLEEAGKTVRRGRTAHRCMTDCGPG